MTTRREAARLAAEAQAILEAAGRDALGTTDPRAAPAALNADQLVVVVNPPTVDYPTWTETTATWEIWLIAGPPDQPDRAWDHLDMARDLLVEPFEVTHAEPNAFTDGQTNTWPALVLSCTSEHDLTQ